MITLCVYSDKHIHHLIICIHILFVNIPTRSIASYTIISEDTMRNHLGIIFLFFINFALCARNRVLDESSGRHVRSENDQVEKQSKKWITKNAFPWLFDTDNLNIGVREYNLKDYVKVVDTKNEVSIPKGEDVEKYEEEKGSPGKGLFTMRETLQNVASGLGAENDIRRTINEIATNSKIVQQVRINNKTIADQTGNKSERKLVEGRPKTTPLPPTTILLTAKHHSKKKVNSVN